jgi:hypothetical protein
MKGLEYVKSCTSDLKEYRNEHVMEPVRTRSGRVSKPPDRYIPTEEVTDDYAREEHDDYDPSDSDDDFEETDEEETDDDDDGDENGNLKGFVVDDEDDEGDEEEA